MKINEKFRLIIVSNIHASSFFSQCIVTASFVTTASFRCNAFPSHPLKCSRSTSDLSLRLHLNADQRQTEILCHYRTEIFIVHSKPQKDASKAERCSTMKGDLDHSSAGINNCQIVNVAYLNSSCSNCCQVNSFIIVAANMRLTIIKTGLVTHSVINA